MRRETPEQVGDFRLTCMTLCLIIQALLVGLLVSCTPIAASPTEKILTAEITSSPSIPVPEQNSTPPVQPQQPQSPATPTLPGFILMPPKTLVINNELSWTECVLPYRDYFHTKSDVNLITDCLRLRWPYSETIDRSLYGQRFRGEVFDDFRLRIGEDSFETKHSRSSNHFFDYELLKNGVPIAKARATFYTFDPNRELRNIGGKSVWEIVAEPPAVFSDGENLNEKFQLEGSYFPHSIRDKLIFIAKRAGKYHVIYDGERIGAEFDEISMAYCCAKISVLLGNEQYWFLGKRDGVQYAIAIQVVIPSSSKAPLVYESPGILYQTLFSLPVGAGKLIQYKIPTCCSNIEGPNAIAILADKTFLITDPLGRRLLNYDQEGQLLRIINLDELGIGYVRDLRVKENEIILLETTYQKFRIHRLTINGEIIASEDIPYQFPFDPKNIENTLEGGLTGVAMDCEGRLILEAAGSKLLPLAEVQKQPDPSQIVQGLNCNGKRFFVSTPGLWQAPQVTAGEAIYETQLTDGLGGLNFLDVFQDGSFYLIRNDVMPVTPIKVDQTIHFIDANGLVLGGARLPLSEYYYPISRNAAVSSDGDVFALLPRPDFLEVVRLNFYQSLEPYMPNAKMPQIIPKSKPSSTHRIGIFEGQPGAFFHAFEAMIENHWRGNVNGNPVLVIAGAWESEPSQGFLMVQQGSRWRYYPSPDKSGKLRIVGFKGDRLLIKQAEEINPIYFDVSKLSYTVSLED